jgi:hypothetical protein
LTLHLAESDYPPTARFHFDALIRWRDTRWGHRTVLPVHDELIVMVPTEDADEATRELVRCMEMDPLGVNIVADPSPAFAWADSA